MQQDFQTYCHGYWNDADGWDHRTLLSSPLLSSLLLSFHLYLYFFFCFNWKDEQMRNNEGELYRAACFSFFLFTNFSCSFAYQLAGSLSWPAINSHYLLRQALFDINYRRVKRMRKARWNKSASESNGKSVSESARYTLMLLWRSLNRHIRNEEREKSREPDPFICK